MTEPATVYLTPIDASIPRTFTLGSNSDVMPIGRASKRGQKGRTPESDNGWFDSRVMSRDHAEIMLGAKNKTIQIEDLGSTHGTYLNNMKLPIHQPAHLLNGDILRFGIDVERHDGELFAALAMRVKMEFKAESAPNESLAQDSDLDVVEVAAPSDTNTPKYDKQHEGPLHQSLPELLDLTNQIPKEQESWTNPYSDPIDLTEPDTVEHEASNVVDTASDKSGASDADEQELESGEDSEFDDELPYYSSEVDSIDDGSESEECDNCIVDTDSMCDDSEQDCIDPALLMATTTKTPICPSTGSFVPAGFTGFTGYAAFGGGPNIPSFPAQEKACATTTVLDCPSLAHSSSINNAAPTPSKAPIGKTSQCATEAPSLKRKLADIEDVESPVRAETAKVADEVDVPHPTKRVKSSQSASSLAAYSATAVISALLGGLGTIAVLASLPPDYFQ